MKPDLATVIDRLEKCLERNTNPERYINQLRELNKLDAPLEIKGPRGQIMPKKTILMHFVETNNTTEVSRLLHGDNPPDPAFQIAGGGCALHRAVAHACQRSDVDLTMITLLMTHSPQSLLVFDRAKMLPLHYSFNNNGNLPVAKQLLQHSAEQQLTLKCNGNVSSIHAAIISKNPAFVMYLMDKYPFMVELTSIDNIGALMAACQSGSVEMVRLFLRDQERAKRLVLNEAKTGIIPLTEAIRNNSQNIVAELLTIEPEKQLCHLERDGKNVLQLACIKKAVKILDVLVNAIAKLSVEKQAKLFLTPSSVDRLTVLQSVVLESSEANYPVEIIDILLRLLTSQQLTATNDDGRIALSIALSHQCRSAACKLLTYAESKQFSATLQERTMLHLAVVYYAEYAISDLLKKLDKEQRCATAYGFAAIHLASYHSQASTLLRLLFVDPDQLNRQSTSELLTPLHLSAMKKDDKSIKFLLNQSKINVELACAKQCIPLHNYLDHDAPSLDIFKLFLEKGSLNQLFAANARGVTPFHIAIIRNATEIVSYIFENYPELHQKLLTTPGEYGVHPLYMAAHSGHLNMVKLLVRQGAVTDITVPKHGSPATAACIKGYREIVKFLFNKNSKLLQPKYGLLRLAAENGHIDIIKDLLALGVGITDGGDNLGAVLYAVLAGQVSVVNFLMEQNSVYINEVILGGETTTLLGIAIAKFDFEMFVALLNLGVDPNYVFNDKNESYTVEKLIEKNLADPELKARFIQELCKARETYQQQCSPMQKIDEQRAKLDSLMKRQPVKASSSTSSVKTSPFVSATSTEESTSSRKYLESAGYNASEIDQWNRERENNKQRLVEPARFPNQTPNRAKPTWFGRLFSSAHPAIYPIEGNGAENTYCYLDKATLIEQGCDLTDNANRRFSNRQIFKLEKIKISHVVAFPKGVEKQVELTHEYKLNKLDRILLFELLSDDRGACLYVGAFFAGTNIREKSKIKALEFGSKKSDAIKVNWPDGDEPVLAAPGSRS